MTINLPIGPSAIPSTPAATAPANEFSAAQTKALFDGLRILLASCDPKDSKHEQVKVLICGCIDAGVNIGKRIVSVVSHLGFDKKHVGKILTDGTGTDSARYWWRKNGDGTYSNLA